MRRSFLTATLALAMSLAIVGCTQPAPAPAPTKAPAAAATPAYVLPTKPAVAPTTAPTAAPAAQATAAPKVAWPEKGKPITIIIPFSAGGGSDIITRMIASYMEKELGTPIQPVNKAGATTMIAMSDLVNAKPDGYTIGMVPLPSIIPPLVDPELKATYKRSDFAPIAAYGWVDMIPAVTPESPFKTVKDWLDACKAKPEGVKVGDSGLMGNAHMLALALALESGVKCGSVHFGGSGELASALLGGHVDVAIQSSTEFSSFRKAESMRALGISGSKRNVFYPEIPTLADQGYKSTTQFVNAISVHQAVPKEIQSTLRDVIKKVAANPEFVKKAGDAGTVIEFADTQQYADLWTYYEKLIPALIDAVKKGGYS